MNFGVSGSRIIRAVRVEQIFGSQPFLLKAVWNCKKLKSEKKVINSKE